MAEYNLSNQSSVTGKLGVKTLAMDSKPVATLMTDELKITKIADKEVWATGNLMYTITVTNTSGVDYTDAELTDTLDSAITLVPDSVTINDVPAVEGQDYTFENGLLTVTLPRIPATIGSAIVMFQVSKV